MKRLLRILLPAALSALLITPAGMAGAGGANYRFDGGTRAQRAQVRHALNASSFDWSAVRERITIHIRPGVVSHALAGEIWLDADLLDSGRFAWAIVQDEYAHQVDLFVFTPEIRARLRRELGAKAWCYEDFAIRQHSDQGCERFASVLAWAYWQSPDNAYRPTSKHDESAAMAPARFRAHLTL